MKDRLTRGAAWIAGTRLIVNLVGFASSILLARLLLPADFGLVAIAMTIAVALGSITDLSLASALVHHENPENKHFDAAWTLNIARAALLAGLMALMAYPVSRLYSDPRLFEIILVLAASTLIGGLNNPKLVVFTRNLVFWQEFVMGVSQKLVGFVVAIAIAVLYQSYWALIIGSAAAQLVGLVVSYGLLPYRPRFQLSGSRSLLTFSIWLTLGRIVNTVTWRSDQLLLGYFFGAKTLGFYTFGDNLAVLPTREAVGPIAQTLFPAFSRLTGDRERLRAAYMRSQTLMCAIALPVGCGFALVARPLALAAVGEKWEPSIFIIQSLASVFAIQIISSTLMPLALAMGETRALFRRDVVNLLFRFPLVTIGLVTGGLIGAVVTRVISEVFITLLNLALVRRLIGISITEQITANGRSGAAVGVMALVLVAVQHWAHKSSNSVSSFFEIAALILTGVATYVITLLVFWFAAGRPAGPEVSMIEIGRSTSVALGRKFGMIAVAPR